MTIDPAHQQRIQERVMILVLACCIGILCFFAVGMLAVALEGL